MGIASWLDTYFSPAILRYLGSDLPQRGKISFEGSGVTVVDDPATKATRVTIGPTATTPTGWGFRRIVNSVEQAVASAVNLATGDVTGTLPPGRGGTGLNAAAISANPSKALVSKSDGSGLELATILDLSTGTTGQLLASDGVGGALWTAPPTLDMAQPNGFRISLASGASVPTADISGSTLYLTPHVGDAISLFDGTYWRIRVSGEVSIALTGLTTGLPYDVFAYWTGSAVALELVAWATASSRASGLTRMSGVRVKSSDLKRRLVGTIVPTAANLCEDRTYRRLVSNESNHVRRTLKNVESTTTWPGGTASVWRQMRAATTNKIDIALVNDIPISLRICGLVISSSAGAVAIGIGLDSTTTNVAQAVANYAPTSFYMPLRAEYAEVVAAGSHALNMLDYTSVSGATFAGALSGLPACAMVGDVFM